MFIALDGVVDPGVSNWHVRYCNAEMGHAAGWYENLVACDP